MQPGDAARGMQHGGCNPGMQHGGCNPSPEENDIFAENLVE